MPRLRRAVRFVTGGVLASWFVVLVGGRASVATALAAANRVEQWGMFELALQGPTNGNPFLDVRFAARFAQGYESVEVAGFYDGDGLYRVRFMPEKQGTWKHETESNAPELNGKTGEVVVTKPSPGNHGPVRVAHVFHFAYADGTPYKQVGTTCYAWTHQPEVLQEQTLKTLATSPFNKIRFCVFPKRYAWNTNEPPLYPFEGRPRSFDTARFNPKFFQQFERRILDLQRLGIEADLILLHPYDQGAWGFDRMTPLEDDRYLRYVVARWAAFRNVWWSLANEYDFMGHKTEEDWERMGQLVARADPFRHLLSIHNGKRLFNHTCPWITHASTWTACSPWAHNRSGICACAGRRRCTASTPLAPWPIAGRSSPAGPRLDRVSRRPQPVADSIGGRARCGSSRWPVLSRWRRECRRVQLHVCVPANTTATISLPAQCARAVRQSSRLLGKTSGDLRAPRALRRRAGKFWTLYGAYPRQGGYELRPGAEGVATSDDGWSWRRATDHPVLSVFDPDCADWEKDCIYQPWLLEHRGRFFNFYNAARGNREQIGLAFSSDLLNWVRYPANPILRNRPGGYDDQFCSDPKVYRVGDHWVMIYFGVGHGAAHIMIAFSRDLVHWTADPEPLYKAGGHPGGLDKQYAHKVSLLYNPANDTFYLYYTAVPGRRGVITGGRGIGLITSKPLPRRLP